MNSVEKMLATIALSPLLDRSMRDRADALLTRMRPFWFLDMMLGA